MRRIVPLILAVALFMELMDSTVIATSLPAIARDIGADPVALKLAMTSYLVALAIFIPISGWMGDRFGVRNVFRMSIVVFMLGSIACALSDSLTSFVAARFFQGMGGAMMAPLARLVLIRSTPKESLVRAMVWLTIPGLIGPMIGPPVGGFITTYFSWHWIFLINIPIGIVGIILYTLFLPPVRQKIDRPFDLKGFLLTGTAFSGILFGASVVSLPALPPYIGAVIFVIGAVSLYLYVQHTRVYDRPVIELSLLRNDVFRASISGAAFLRLCVGAVPFVFPLMMQLGFGKSAFETGQVMLFGAVGALMTKFFVQRLYHHFGFRQVMLVVGVMTAGTVAAMGLFNSDTPLWMMASVMVMSGLIRSCFFTGAQAISYSEIKSEHISHGTALNAVAQQLTLAMAVAVAGIVLEVLGLLRGGELALADYRIAFFVVAAIGVCSFIPFLSLPRSAGSNVTGHVEEETASS